MLGITFGSLLVESTSAALANLGRDADQIATHSYSSANAWAVVRYELVAGGLALLVLGLRGKRLSDFGTRITWRLTALGASLTLATYLLWSATGWLLGEIFDADTLAGTPLDAPISWFPMLVLVIVNPLFEEIFVGGYALSTLAALRGPRFALVVTTLVRMGYHTYQGLPGVAGNLCVGLLFGAVYLRGRQLWPLVLAHALLDLIGLLALRG